MTTASSFPAARNLPGIGLPLRVVIFSLVILSFASAQTVSAPGPSSKGSLDLPDAPGFAALSSEGEAVSAANSLSSSNEDREESAASAFDPIVPPPKRHHRIATLSDMTIQPGRTPQKLTAHQTTVLGLSQSFTLFSALGWLASAGYTQLTNGSPNYGVDSGAFGERLGAAALRNTSQNIIGNAVLAPLFHEDPRYFKLGTKYGFIHRTAYAVTRVLVTKNDDGDARPNFSLLGGHLAGAALTNTYYPQHNQGFSQTGKTFGTALGGAAVGFFVTEFIDDALGIAHLQSLE